MQEQQPEQTQSTNYIRGAIEALLFVNERPVTLEQIKRVLLSVTPSDIKQVIESLSEEYRVKGAGMNIVEIAGGYQMLSNPDYARYIREFYKTKHKEKLSKPALETLAIIAYKQPVSRTDIELIRGVNSDGVVNHLVDKELIKIVGRKEVPGRPFLYGTTKQFLEYFGLKSLDNLPRLEEFPNLKPAIEAESETNTESNENIPSPVPGAGSNENETFSVVPEVQNGSDQGEKETDEIKESSQEN